MSTQMPTYPKGLIEVDQPNQQTPANLRRKKSSQLGHLAKLKALLEAAGKQLHSVMQEDALMAECPVEVQSAMQSAAESIGAARGRLESMTPQATPSATQPGGPTRQQGQFLAFIHEYILRNEAGIAPSHANLQRFFNLTAPSVNSMLVRLEQRGFIRRIPGKARAIEVVCPPDFIPALERPFKF
jgi:repressor LexA